MRQRRRRKNRSRGFLDEGQLLHLLGTGADDHAADAVAVSIQKLSGGMDDHVGTESDGLLEIGRHESVVDHEVHFLAAADLADGGDVG